MVKKQSNLTLDLVYLEQVKEKPGAQSYYLLSDTCKLLVPHNRYFLALT